MDPPYIQALKGEFGMMKFGWFRNYHAKYMVQARMKPVIHVITFIMTLGYIMEYPHLKRTHPPALAPPTPPMHRSRADERGVTASQQQRQQLPLPASTSRGTPAPHRPFAPAPHPHADEKHAARKKAALDAIENGGAAH